MTEFWPVARHALLSGVVLTATIFPLLLILLWYNPEIMLNDYPPDIRAKHGPMSERSKRQRVPVAIAFSAVVLAIIVASFPPVRGADGRIPFVIAFVHLFVMFSVGNVLDWLVLDWLLLVWLRPEFFVLPGTEGLAGYRSYWFHFRGFLIGIPITFVASVLVAGIATFL